jgi:hypothetical protein
MPGQKSRVFLEDMLSDSIRLEKEGEPAQAFDKLARAIESLLPAGSHTNVVRHASALGSRFAATSS